MAACLKQGESAQEEYKSAVQASGSCARQVHGAIRGLTLIADELRNLRILLNLEIDRRKISAHEDSLPPEKTAAPIDANGTNGNGAGVHIDLGAQAEESDSEFVKYRSKARHGAGFGCRHGE